MTCCCFLRVLTSPSPPPFPHRRRVSTRASSASQQQVNPNHWSRRVTSDNPHGFTDKTLARLRAIEDPAEREKEEKKLLDMRRRNEKRLSDAKIVARIRDHQNERYRKRKINARYVMLVAVLNNFVLSHCKLVFSPFTAIMCSHATLFTGVSVYLTTTRVDTIRSRCRGLLMRIH
jgi:hypothetical protein